MVGSEWTKSEHVDRHLAHADTFPHRAEGESVLLDHVPLGARRILDLGTGDGHLLALLRAGRPESMGVAVDVSRADARTRPQLRWLRELGFEDVDCYWNWLEMGLLIGVKPAR